jgi:putative Mn2+ efflux pump MntP
LDLTDIVFIAIGLAMDALAVSIAACGTGRIDNKRAIFRLSFHFGFFQFLMPIIGWFAGVHLESIIATYDHWIAFFLLQFVALRMITSIQKSQELALDIDPSKGFSLIVLSIATSIDALAVGFALGLINISIWYPSIIIGVITAGMSLTGIAIGNFANEKLGKWSTIFGALILSIIGFRILLSHL